MTALHDLHSSLRTRPAEETIAIARQLARELGIVRVTETTRLDRVGIPVAASIRPSAMPGSLCVSAGKGLRPIEAIAGAYMEAIELAWAEPSRAQIELQVATARDVLDGRARPEAIYDFGGLEGVAVDLDAPLDCVVATDVTSGERVLVPAALVLYPMPPERRATALYALSHGNGLCSGNTVDEATVHGLGELVERDVIAFNSVRDDSRLIDPGSLPPVLRDLHAQVCAEGFELFLRELPNPFGLPCFWAVLHEPGATDAVHSGYGCSPSLAIAAVRAVVEAAQARLTVIHGARDDLPAHFARLEGRSHDDRRRVFDQIVEVARDPARSARYDEIVDHAADAPDLPRALALFGERLARQGLRRILRVVYTPEEYPLQVVRVIVPGLELALAGVDQRGARLRRFRDQVANQDAAVRWTDPGRSQADHDA